MRTMPLRRLVMSLDNGTWGDEPANGEGVSCVRAADFAFDRLRVAPERLPLRRIEPRLLKRLALRPGDLILEKSGGGDHLPVGRAVLYDLDQHAVPTNFAARLRPESFVDSRFLGYVLAAHFWAGATARCIKQTTGIQNLDTDAWLETLTPCPEMLEQRRIAEFLDDQVARLDAVDHARGRQLRGLKAATLSAAHEEIFATHVSKRRPSSLPWAVDLPDHWDEVLLRLVATMGTGHTPSRSEPDYWIDCDIPWLTTADVRRFRADQIDIIGETAIEISQRGLDNSAAVVHPAGTVVLSRTASAGFSVVMERDMATSQDYVTWTPGERLRSPYLLWCLRVMRRDLLERLAMGSTHKTIYFPDLEGIRIPLPPLDEQDTAIAEIDSRVAAVRQTMTAIERSRVLAQERKRALITAAVAGEFDVTAASGRGVA